MFKHFVLLCEDFKGVGWDETQRSWLVARMKRKVNFTSKELAQPVAGWDVSALCAALLAVLRPSEDNVVEEVKKVRASRNTTLHVQGASCDDLKKCVKAVQSLIELVKPMFPDQPWDDCLKELDSAADSELCCDH